MALRPIPPAWFALVLLAVAAVGVAAYLFFVLGHAPPQAEGPSPSEIDAELEALERAAE